MIGGRAAAGRPFQFSQDASHQYYYGNTTCGRTSVSSIGSRLQAGALARGYLPGPNALPGSTMSEPSAAPEFTGAELALADTIILIMKVMAMRGIIDEEGINTVFRDLIGRYQGEQIHSAAAMAEYLRQNTLESDGEPAPQQQRATIETPPEGSG